MYNLRETDVRSRTKGSKTQANYLQLLAEFDLVPIAIARVMVSRGSKPNCGSMRTVSRVDVDAKILQPAVIEFAIYPPFPLSQPYLRYLRVPPRLLMEPLSFLYQPAP